MSWHDWVRAARTAKANGNLYGHKHCLRVARAEVNLRRLTRGQPARYDRLAWVKAQDSVVVQRNPTLPGTWQARLRMRGRGFDVVVMHPPGGRGGKSIAGLLAAMAFARAEIIAVDEADSVPEGVWERIGGVGIVASRQISLEPGVRCGDMTGIVYGPHSGELARDRSLCMSRGDKIRQRKMFGGW